MPQPKNILLIEDNQFDRELEISILTRHYPGVRVAVLHEITEAIQFFSTLRSALTPRSRLSEFLQRIGRIGRQAARERSIPDLVILNPTALFDSRRDIFMAILEEPYFLNIQLVAFGDSERQSLTMKRLNGRFIKPIDFLAFRDAFLDVIQSASSKPETQLENLGRKEN